MIKERGRMKDKEEYKGAVIVSLYDSPGSEINSKGAGYPSFIDAKTVFDAYDELLMDEVLMYITYDDIRGSLDESGFEYTEDDVHTIVDMFNVNNLETTVRDKLDEEVEHYIKHVIRKDKKAGLKEHVVNFLRDWCNNTSCGHCTFITGDEDCLLVKVKEAIQE